MPDFSGSAVGVSWECASSNHIACNTPGCRCPHHYRPVTQPGNGIDRVQTDPGRIPTPPHDPISPPPPMPSSDTPQCSVCGTMGKAGDKFCRRDGTRLTSSLHCPHCGIECGTGDLHCAGCGASLSDELSVKTL